MEHLLLTLAIWRISSLLTNIREIGPFRVLPRIRKWLGVRFDSVGQCYSDNEIGKALCCLWCTSIWIAIPAVVLAQQPAILVFAYSAGAILVDALVKGVISNDYPAR